VLAAGEPGYESDTGQFKFGDGTTAWNSLGYSTFDSAADSVLLNDGVSPSAPGSGLLFYAQSRAGRRLPAFMGPSGLDTSVQPAMFANGIISIAPSATTAFSVWGGPTFTAVGTVSHPTISATTVLKEGVRRAIVTSAATANSASELRIAATLCYRGDLAGFGGFFQRWRWGRNTAVANQRTAVGLWASTGATATTQSPSALTNCILLGNDSADTNMQIMHNDGAGACTKINLGSEFPANSTTAIYDFDLFAAPNSNQVGYRVKNLVSGAEATGTITTDLPATTTFLAPHAYANNGGTAAAVVLDFYRYYLETDY
jgi:hypothetical protein